MKDILALLWILTRAYRFWLQLRKPALFLELPMFREAPAISRHYRSVVQKGEIGNPSLYPFLIESTYYFSILD